MMLTVLVCTMTQELSGGAAGAKRASAAGQIGVLRGLSKQLAS